MLKWLSIVCCIILSSSAFGQDSLKVMTWENALKANPDSVFAIDASHLKWESVPEELYKYKNLRYLNLSRNKLTVIPAQIREFENLRWLSVERNRINDGLGNVFTLANLKYLDIGKNEFESIPATIGNMKNLEVFILWANPVTELPMELTQCSSLKAVDMRSILTSASFQMGWTDRMPKVNWQFDSPCHCAE
jgi:Leucine-rich repeat (LRR) protein